MVQFLSAFNDNFVSQNAGELSFRFGGEKPSIKILLAMIVFILPADSLSHLGARIAD